MKGSNHIALTKNMIYEAFVPQHTPLIRKNKCDIEKEFNIKICLINTSSIFFEVFDKFRTEGNYLKIREFRKKYNLW